MTPWTEARKEQVRALWPTHSASDLMRLFNAEGANVTRNSVVGIVHRMDLPDKPKPIRIKTQRLRKHDYQHVTRKAVTARLRTSNGTGNHGGLVFRTMTAKIPALRCVEIACTVPFADVTGCRYTPDNGPFLFCDGPQQPGSSFCPAHHSICWEAPKPAKESGFREQVPCRA